MSFVSYLSDVRRELLREHRGHVDEHHDVAVLDVGRDVGAGRGLDDVGHEGVHLLGSQAAHHLGQALGGAGAVHARALGGEGGHQPGEELLEAALSHALHHGAC